LKPTKIRHAWSEHKDFELFRPNGTLNEYIFLHFWNPMRILYKGNNITTFPNACIIFSPGTPQHFGSHEETIHDWVHITPDVAELLDKYNIETDRIYYPKNHGFITDIIRRIEVESRSEGMYSDMICDCLIRELIIRLARAVNSKSDTERLNRQSKEQLKQLRRMLHFDYAKRWDISDMAKCINISPSYLHSAYKKLYGVSPMQDLINIRIEQAKSMLAESQKSIADIAREVGYTSSTHFIRQFSKNVGVSPLKYRQNNLLEHRNVFD